MGDGLFYVKKCTFAFIVVIVKGNPVTVTRESGTVPAAVFCHNRTRIGW